MAETPLTVLERLVDQRVLLRLKDGRELEGKLLGVDEHLNLALDDGSEKAAEVSRHLGRVVVRGSNVMTLLAPSASSSRSKGR